MALSNAAGCCVLWVDVRAAFVRCVRIHESAHPFLVTPFLRLHRYAGGSFATTAACTGGSTCCTPMCTCLHTHGVTRRVWLLLAESAHLYVGAGGWTTRGLVLNTTTAECDAKHKNCLLGGAGRRCALSSAAAAAIRGGCGLRRVNTFRHMCARMNTTPDSRSVLGDCLRRRLESAGGALSRVSAVAGGLIDI